jgi:hypothetical protein
MDEDNSNEDAFNVIFSDVLKLAKEIKGLSSPVSRDLDNFEIYGITLLILGNPNNKEILFTKLLEASSKRDLISSYLKDLSTIFSNS